MNTLHIRKAVAEVGGNVVLAKLIGAPPSLVSQWVTGRRPVASTWCIAIEQATKGKVTRYDLRFDVFGPAPAEPSREVANAA